MTDRARRFGRFLMNARKDAGLTQRQLAERVGVGAQTTVSMWETGRAWPNVDTFFRLADILKIDVAELMGQMVDTTVEEVSA